MPEFVSLSKAASGYSGRALARLSLNLGERLLPIPLGTSPDFDGAEQTNLVLFHSLVG